jgi:uncharacterized protein YbaR (Trm112 family)
MLASELIELLRCPQTGQPLTAAPGEFIAGRCDRDGRPLGDALLREDRAVLYPIRDGIPVLLAEEAIPA